MKINYNLLICLFSFIMLASISSCIKPVEPTPQPPKQTFCDTCLPPITTTGPTSFGCRVNGKVWLPKDGWNFYSVKADYYERSISIIGTKDEPWEKLGFGFDSISDTGTFTFPNNIIKNSGASFGLINKPITERYIANPITKGKIRFLRFDIDSGKYAGTFEFDVYSNDFKDTIHITDGRFMINK
ncbi:MAG: hypothetical protein ACK44D_02630 [Bacteroidia bacterium]